MTITVKLFASLTARLPAEAGPGHAASIEVTPDTTVSGVAERLGIPESLCGIVLVDGQWVSPSDRPNRVLRDGQVLSIWPPVAGG